MTRSTDIYLDLATVTRRMLDDVDDARRSGRISGEDADRFKVACVGLLHNLPSPLARGRACVLDLTRTEPAHLGPWGTGVRAVSLRSSRRSAQEADIFVSVDPFAPKSWRAYSDPIFKRRLVIDRNFVLVTSEHPEPTELEFEPGPGLEPDADVKTSRSAPQASDADGEAEDMARIRARTAELRRQFAQDRERLDELVGRPN
jgi:hypothetical protein